MVKSNDHSSGSEGDASSDSSFSVVRKGGRHTRSTTDQAGVMKRNNADEVGSNGYVPPGSRLTRSMTAIEQSKPSKNVNSLSNIKNQNQSTDKKVGRGGQTRSQVNTRIRQEKKGLSKVQIKNQTPVVGDSQHRMLIPTPLNISAAHDAPIMNIGSLIHSKSSPLLSTPSSLCTYREIILSTPNDRLSEEHASQVTKESRKKENLESVDESYQVFNANSLASAFDSVLVNSVMQETPVSSSSAVTKASNDLPIKLRTNLENFKGRNSTIKKSKTNTSQELRGQGYPLKPNSPLSSQSWALTNSIHNQDCIPGDSQPDCQSLQATQLSDVSFNRDAIVHQCLPDEKTIAILRSKAKPSRDNSQATLNPKTVLKRTNRQSQTNPKSKRSGVTILKDAMISNEIPEISVQG
jgi:hypothetical protein